MKYLLSWFLYWVGCVISEIMYFADNISDWLYPAYNKVMSAASKIQGEGSGPWIILKEDEDG